MLLGIKVWHGKLGSHLIYNICKEHIKKSNHILILGEWGRGLKKKEEVLQYLSCTDKAAFRSKSNVTRGKKYCVNDDKKLTNLIKTYLPPPWERRRTAPRAPKAAQTCTKIYLEFFN